jgi:hypothetical protein
MLDTLPLFPAPFWLAAVALIFFGLQAWSLRDTSIGIPMLVVLATAGFWYFGDVLYNDYTDYLAELNKGALEAAWWEVLAFICVFGLLAPRIHDAVNGKFLRRPSVMLQLVRHGGIKSTIYQNQIDAIFMLVFIAWVILMSIALIRTNFDFQGIFAPYLSGSDKDDPWGRGRVGSGLDSLLAVAGYFQIGLTAMYGVIAAVSSRPRTFYLALIGCLLMLPFYLFDRTRSTMLVVLLPGFLSLVFIRLRVSFLVRVIILVVGFVALESWLKFIIESRGEQTITAAFIARMNSKIVDPATDKHLGLNMFEELGFINGFLDDGTFRPNWGEEYFAEIVNPIPRVLWSGKPMIGIDYAIARGLTFQEADSNEAGVGASLSTGMVGQGGINFGPYLGPTASAFLLSLWVAFLARLDIRGNEVWRLLLYGLGLVLTFNMGRDVTLLVIYPFVFFYIGFMILRQIVPGLRAPQNASRAQPVSPLQFAKVTSAKPF